MCHPVCECGGGGVRGQVEGFGSSLLPYGF